MSSVREQGKMESSKENTLAWRISLAVANCLQLLIVGLLFDFVVFSGTGIDGRLRVVTIAIVLAGITRSYGWLALVTIQIKLFFYETSRSDLELSMGAFFYGVGALMLISYALAAQRLAPKLSRSIAATLFQLVIPDQAADDMQRPERYWRKKRIVEIVVWFMMLNIAVFLAIFLLAFLPLTPQSSRAWFRLSISNGGFLWPGPTVVIVGLVLVLLVREFSWRQINPSQARLWFRSRFMLDHRRDLLMIVRRRLKARKKAAALAAKS